MLPAQPIQYITRFMAVPPSMYMHIKHIAGVSGKMVTFCILVLLHCPFKYLHTQTGDPT